MERSKTNPVKEQDRVRDLFEHFEQYGDVMFRQQRAIYEGIAAKTRHQNVIEVGCGNGVGSAILAHGRRNGLLRASDISINNIKFARCLYPWISFHVMDITCELPDACEDLVAVEVLEHVSHPQVAVDSMLKAASNRVWISTPNGHGKPRPPENPYHVCEYTIAEVLDMLFINPCVQYVEVWAWDGMGMGKLPAVAFRDTRDPMPSSDPLVYCAVLK